MPINDTTVATTEAQPIGTAAEARVSVAQCDLELEERQSARREWPKITLVTAVYNGEEYLEATIRSIVNQGYPNLEYIVVDDGSTDRTAEIIRKYEREVSCWFSQANQGLYAALNAGFARSTGEIMGWLNSSDMLQVNGLFTVGSIFRELRDGMDYRAADENQRDGDDHRCAADSAVVARALSGGGEQIHSAGVDFLAAKLVGARRGKVEHGVPRGRRLRAVGAIFPARAAAFGKCADRWIPTARSRA